MKGGGCSWKTGRYTEWVTNLLEAESGHEGFRLTCTTLGKQHSRRIAPSPNPTIRDLFEVMKELFTYCPQPDWNLVLRSLYSQISDRIAKALLLLPSNQRNRKALFLMAHDLPRQLPSSTDFQDPVVSQMLWDLFGTSPTTWLAPDKKGFFMAGHWLARDACRPVSKLVFTLLNNSRIEHTKRCGCNIHTEATDHPVMTLLDAGVSASLVS